MSSLACQQQLQSISSDCLQENTFLLNTREHQESSTLDRLLPLWVKPVGDGQFVVLWRPRGWTPTNPVSVHVLRGTERPPWEWTLKLWKRLDDFSTLEKAKILHALSESGCAEDQLLMVMKTYLDLPRSRSWLKVYRSIPSQPDPVKEALKNEILDPRHLHYLSGIDDELSGLFLKKISQETLSLSVQKTRQWVEAVHRLKQPQRKEIHSWLRNQSDSDDAENCGKRLLQLTRKCAYPTLMEREKQFTHDLETLDLPGSIRVKHPNNFEGDYLDFRIRCHRDQSLEKLSEELKKCQLLLKHV